jgi:hypothetical protein
MDGAAGSASSHSRLPMRANKNSVTLPIGRTARMAIHLDALRVECCHAAEQMMKAKRVDLAELEECARLDDALAEAHRTLKTAINRIAIARIKRRSEAR